MARKGWLIDNKNDNSSSINIFYDRSVPARAKPLAFLGLVSSYIVHRGRHTPTELLGRPFAHLGFHLSRAFLGLLISTHPGGGDTCHQLINKMANISVAWHTRSVGGVPTAISTSCPPPSPPSHRRFVRSALEEPHGPDFPHAKKKACQDDVETRVVDRRHHQGADEKRRGENLHRKERRRLYIIGRYKNKIRHKDNEGKGRFFGRNNLAQVLVGDTIRDVDTLYFFFYISTINNFAGIIYFAVCYFVASDLCKTNSQS